MANYNHGISYIRTTRMETPVIYNAHEKFSIGGCKVLRSSDNDAAVVIGAGITLHEALKAYDSLAAQGIKISVIDLYSIKPIDTQTIIATARSAKNNVITVEDHYLQGGLGQTVAYELRNTDIAITCLAVTQLPRSGKPEELMAWAGIDAQAIEKAVKDIIRQ
jgi:transketolase